MTSLLIVTAAVAMLLSPLAALCGRGLGGLVERATRSPRWRERGWSLGFHLPAAGVLQAVAVCAALSVAPSRGLAATAHAAGRTSAGLPPLAAIFLALCAGLAAVRLALLWRRQRLLARVVAADAISADVDLRRRLGGVAGGVAPSVVVSPRTVTPLLLGIRRPSIVLPHRLVRDCAPEPLARICAHELAHLRRADNLRLVVEEALGAAFWFDPQMRVMKRRLRSAREEACDALALCGAGRSTRRLYAAALTSVLGRAAAPSAWAAFRGAGGPAAQRIGAILRPPPEPGAALRLALAAGLLGAGAVVSGGTAALALGLANAALS